MSLALACRVMNTRLHLNVGLRLFARTAVTVVVCSLLGQRVARSAPNPGYVAHEWGTFTSVQGGDGTLLDWRPLESSRLPHFVYDWRNPGPERQAPMELLLIKSEQLTLQRMETPVIYFYADRAQTVDALVRFPKGRITEWYPQASQIGPSMARPTPPDVDCRDTGAAKKQTSTDQTERPSTAESLAHWAKVRILPPHERADATLPTDTTGSHYFAARNTDANLVASGTASDRSETEKFIFYRGVGSFATPLRVTMQGSAEVTLSNTGTEALTHLFLLGLQNGAGRFIYVPNLAAGETRKLALDPGVQAVDLQQLSGELGNQMAASLEKEGLYAREAAAMVQTWKDSWFEEDGLRVLYVLPRAWTDRTLPLTLSPAPQNLVRVMVGRAELLTPALEQGLAQALDKARQGDTTARTHAMQTFRRLGRFGEAALRLAIAGATSEANQSAWSVYHSSFEVSTRKPL
jgi:hypothetical protein